MWTPVCRRQRRSANWARSPRAASRKTISSLSRISNLFPEDSCASRSSLNYHMRQRRGKRPTACVVRQAAATSLARWRRRARLRYRPRPPSLCEVPSSARPHRSRLPARLRGGKLGHKSLEVGVGKIGELAERTPRDVHALARKADRHAPPPSRRSPAPGTRRGSPSPPLRPAPWRPSW